MMRWLDEEILAYEKSGAYPFHMPGSKRKNPGLLKDPYLYDITEIEGFDDLRSPEGLLAELEEGWAGLYGAGHAFLSVNGSTCGNISTIFAATKEYDTVLIADGAHRSVYNAAKIRKLKVASVHAKMDECGFYDPPEISDFIKALEENKKATVAIITSPTYEGLVCDVRSFAREAHKRGVSLLVDSAHGAHFGIPIWGEDEFAKRIGHANPISLGADAAVVSLHKTLPVFGQTSLVLVPKEEGYIEAGAIKDYMNIFQTSSPSYLLMSGASAGLRLIQNKGMELAKALAENLKSFYGSARGLKNIEVMIRDDQDLSKIIITTKRIGIKGREIMSILREEFGLELERSGEYYALCLCGIMDEKEGFLRLLGALEEIDGRA